jgi:hypothetical protein
MIDPKENISHFLIGRPLQTADAPHQTIGKAVGLAVFASDALSSTAYATQEILVILAAAGTIAFGYVMSKSSMPIQMAAARMWWPMTTSVIFLLWSRPQPC